MNKLNFLIILNFTVFIFAKGSYVWPTNASTTVTALFGEERPHRYHAGLDIRTWGKIGYKLYAVDDGYIKRIRTSSKGYGKAVYIQLTDGNTAVYAHLDKFTPLLDNSAKSLQQYYNSYTIDHVYSKNEFPVRRGDLIGYSGDTGGISGAHLHFELRDKFGKPLNPLQFFSIKDNLPPIPNQIAITPLDNKTKINGSRFYKIIDLVAKNPNEYYFSDTICVDGSFGIALDVIDKIDDQPFDYGIYKISLKVNDSTMFNVSYDMLQFEDAKFIYTDRDYSLKKEHGNQFYRLYGSNKNENLIFMNESNTYGFFLDKFDLHRIEIIVEDYFNNQVLIKGVIVNENISNLNLNLNNRMISIVADSLNSLESVKFIKTGRHLEDKKFPINLESLNSNSYHLPDWNKPFTVLEVQPIHKYGIKSPSIFLPTKNYTNNLIAGEIEIKHFNNGVAFQFNEEFFSGILPKLSFVKDGYLMEYQMNRIEKNTLSTEPIMINEINQLNSFEIVYDNETEYSFKKEISSTTTFPEKDFKLSINAGEMYISGNKNIYHDTTFVWIEKIAMASPKKGKIVSGPYKVGPSLIPMIKHMELTFSLFDSSKFNSSAIFYYDKKKDSWNYMNTKKDNKNLELSTRILSGEVFAVIQELTPPVMFNLYPSIDATYRKQDLNYLEFYIEDDFSGIDGENNITIIIDEGKPLIFEYNIYQKRVFYSFNNSFKPGYHSLYIRAKDNVGNEKVVRGNFNIK